jgi:hypothetical protein
MSYRGNDPTFKQEPASTHDALWHNTTPKLDVQVSALTGSVQRSSRSLLSRPSRQEQLTDMSAQATIKRKTRSAAPAEKSAPSTGAAKTKAAAPAAAAQSTPANLGGLTGTSYLQARLVGRVSNCHSDGSIDNSQPCAVVLRCASLCLSADTYTC